MLAEGAESGVENTLEKISLPHPNDDVGLRPTDFGFNPRQVDINEPLLLQDADKLVKLVYEYFDSTIASLSNNQRGSVLAGVMHRTQSIIRFDINQVKPYKEIFPLLHPIFLNRLNRYIDDAADSGLISVQLLGKELPGIHAEVKAASQVLFTLEEQLSRKAAIEDLDDLLIFNIRMAGSQKGESIIRCPNCQVLTRDILSISDLADEFLQKLSSYRKTLK
ncbi:hypothetical protein DSM106972_027670 [Dulcicalothrix desertica PCC 7102]|uniref:Uncharacterized protein n=1 Tax=Dulcicalothrix desertica PCC 7102 TaxID=232991 RepID=A0A3S5K3C6_9CYAN|nr:YwqJ-related putative deaminase [Dulcicalothrix desertica]RUT06510.1 hypothetical protein DSM106972_027670 [Dulcicalothrix desertica PCC 7102]TWH50376.1 YwqJ-like deaminase [Dulcicalothrix desertica PCC 7102]